MTRLEAERERYCRRERCKDFRFCAVKWGKDCSRIDGHRVPRLRKPQEEVPIIVTVLDGEIRVRKNPWRSAFANDF